MNVWKIRAIEAIKLGISVLIRLWFEHEIIQFYAYNIRINIFIS